jgi:hypothetical protein
MTQSNTLNGVEIVTGEMNQHQKRQTADINILIWLIFNQKYFKMNKTRKRGHKYLNR